MVAYNHALDASRAACSDGVIIDTYVPVVTEIVLKHAVVAPALLQDTASNDVFFMHRNREVEAVTDPSHNCR